MTGVILLTLTIAAFTVGFLALAWWVIGYFTRDTGTHAAPRHRHDEPPDEFLPAPPPWEVAHDGDQLDWLAERHDWHEVIVANVHTPTPPGPPLDYGYAEPFNLWESDTFVGGFRAITARDGAS